MTIFPDIITLQEYPPNFNTTLSNANKLLLKISINKAQTVGYEFSSQQPSKSSSTSSRRRTRNQQHQQYETPSVPLIAGINRTARRSRTDVDE